MPKKHINCECKECTEWREDMVWGIYVSGDTQKREEEEEENERDIKGEETEEVQSGDLPVFEG